MSRHVRFLRFGATLVVVTIAGVIPIATPATAAECPPSSVQLSATSGPFEYPLAVLDTTYSAMTFSAHAAYDLRQGTAALSVTPVSAETLLVTPIDYYELVGLPDGTPADITWVIDYDGWIDGPECVWPDCRAHVAVLMFNQFWDARAVVPAASSGGRTSESGSVELVTRMLAGQPHRMFMWLEILVGALGQFEGALTTRLRFSNVPAGARIVSCQGYGDVDTPIRASTWGRIKAAYR